jgi:hypothetical protein
MSSDNAVVDSEPVAFTNEEAKQICQVLPWCEKEGQNGV